MIGFFLDNALTVPAPKYVTAPTRGAARQFSLYLGDPAASTWVPYSRNLIQDSDLSLGTTDWPTQNVPISIGAGDQNNNAFAWNGTGGVVSQESDSVSIPVTTGATYTFSSYMDASQATSGSMAWTLERSDFGAQIGQLLQPAGSVGRISVTVIIPAGTTTLILRAQTSTCLVPSGKSIKWSSPQLETGSLATDYTNSSNDRKINVSVSDSQTVLAGYTARLYQLKNPADPAYGLPGVLLNTGAASVAATPLQIMVQIQVPAGSVTELDYVTIQADPLSNTTFPTGVVPRCRIDLRQADDLLPVSMNLLPLTRKIAGALQGFGWDAFRWRDESSINAVPLAPSIWTNDPSPVGVEKFVPGVADATSLTPFSIVENGSASNLQVTPGHYYTGPHGYSLAGDGQVNDIFPAGATSFSLTRIPSPQSALYAGDFVRSTYGDYEQNFRYRYTGAGFDSDSRPQFRVTRSTRTLQLNQSMPTSSTYLVGFLSGQSTDYVYLPTWPVWSIQDLWVAGAVPVHIPASSYSYNIQTGLLTISTSQVALQLVQTLPAHAQIWATVNRAMVVSYDSGTAAEFTVDVDLNPAVAGTNRGYVFLAHNARQPVSAILGVDKPAIAVPASKASIIGLTAFGPVYWSNDYALLQITAYDHPGEPLPGVTFLPVISSDWQGQLNYVDPSTSPVTVTTGADGKANVVYTAGTNTGQYIQTSAVSGTTLTLPADVPIAQIHNTLDTWLVVLYQVLDNNPAYGSTTAVTANGEIPWVTSGSGITFRTNGQKILWTGPSGAVLPSDALDVNGFSYTDAVHFNGLVHSLVYTASIPTGSTTGAYYVAYAKWVTLAFQARGSNVITNSVLLQMAVPPLITNPGTLILDTTSGVLSQNRLGQFNPGTAGPGFDTSGASTATGQLARASNQPVFPVDNSVANVVSQLPASPTFSTTAVNPPAPGNPAQLPASQRVIGLI